MTVRHLVKCKACSHPITLRILLGHDTVQEHVFDCPNCAVELRITLNLDQENGKWIFKDHDNITLWNEEGTVINLNPAFLLDKEDVNKDGPPTWMNQLIALHRHTESRNGRPINADLVFSKIAYEWKEQLSFILTHYKKNRLDLVSNSLKLPIITRQKEIETYFLQLLIRFLWRLTVVGNRIDILDSMKLIVDQITHNQIETSQWYNLSMRPSLLENIFEFLTVFFANADNIRQVIPYANYGLTPPRQAEPTSFDFDSLKRLYEINFETLGVRSEALYYLFTKSNNLKFDRQRFVSKSKSKRHELFLTFNFQNFDYFLMGQQMRAIIRNSIVHNSNRILIDGKIEFKDDYKGKVRYHELSKADFLKLCVTSSSFLSSIFICELLLVNHIIHSE